MEGSSWARGFKLALILACVSGLVIGLPASAGAYPFERLLREGAYGRDVKALEVRIAGWYPERAQVDIGVDKSFTDRTTRAVTAFKEFYGLRPDGVAGMRVYALLDRLEDSDRSTLNFAWSEFKQNYNSSCSVRANSFAGTFKGGMVGSRTVRKYVRRLMWRLEAIRAKSGGHPIGINSGFRSVAYNSCIGGAAHSQHMYGAATDNRMADVGNRRERNLARSSQMHGIGCYANTNHNHFDVRIENQDLESSRFWWWPRRDGARRDLDDYGHPCYGETAAKAGSVARAGHSGFGWRVEQPPVLSEAQLEAFEAAGEPADLEGAD